MLRNRCVVLIGYFETVLDLFIRIGFERPTST